MLKILVAIVSTANMFYMLLQLLMLLETMRDVSQIEQTHYSLAGERA